MVVHDVKITTSKLKTLATLGPVQWRSTWVSRACATAGTSSGGGAASPSFWKPIRCTILYM